MAKLGYLFGSIFLTAFLLLGVASFAVNNPGKDLKFQVEEEIEFSDNLSPFSIDTSTSGGNGNLDQNNNPGLSLDLRPSLVLSLKIERHTVTTRAKSRSFLPPYYILFCSLKIDPNPKF